MTPAVETLVAAVGRHARLLYRRGWDEVVECWSDDEIAQEVANCRTERGAIRKMAAIVGVRYERRREIEATAF